MLLAQAPVDAITQVLTRDSFSWIVPETVLIVAACAIFVGGTFRSGRCMWGTAALLSLAGAGMAWWLAPAAALSKAAGYASPVILDHLAVFFKVLSLAGGAILVLITWDEVAENQAAEYHGCLLVIVAGMCLTGAANDLITLFLALELISIPTYVLLYLSRHDTKAQEAAMKYFLLSIFSSAFLLFGFSYLYGLTGTTNLPAITEALTRGEGVVQPQAYRLPVVAMAALVFIVAGLGFRLTVVPFHFYAPDVYQGTSPGAAGLLAFVPKVAGLAALLRVLNLVPQLDLVKGVVQSGPIHVPMLMGFQVSTLFWIVAAVSMTLGNILALLQDNLKRLMAYSSIAHAGYLLIGLAVAPHLQNAGAAIPGGVESALFYLIAYGAMTVGAFAVIGYLNATSDRPVETVDDLGGLVKSHPVLATVMGLFLFSLIGIPPTAGFFGKFFLFLGAMAVPSFPGDPDTVQQARLFRILALLAALNAAVGGWYYLRIAAVIFLRNPIKPLQNKKAWPGLAGIGACAAVTLILAVYSWPYVQGVVVPK